MVSSHIIRLFALSLFLLASCGGGRDSSQTTRSPLDAPRTAVAADTECGRERPATPSVTRSMLTHRLVNGECLRSFTGFDRQLAQADVRRRALATATPRVPTVTELFDWAETAYPAYFPAHQSNRQLGPYVYRYYSGSQNHAAVDGTRVYVQGPISGGGLLYVGEIADFACLVFPASCGPAPRACEGIGSWTVGGQVCTPNADQTGQIASGQSFAYTDSVGDTRGTATYACTDGSLTLNGSATCDQRAPLACNTSGLTWTVASHVCVANAGEPVQLASGTSHTFLASSGKVGTASYACNDGTLTATAVAVCDAPTPVYCRPATVSWTKNGLTCTADSVPDEIAGGGIWTFFDAIGTPTGSATYSCTAAGLVSQGDENCVDVPHMQDSFGGDGGAADGGASGDGTAGDGAPIVGGLVTVVDMNGKTTSATTNSIGYFRVKLTGFTPPLVIAVTRPDGKVRRSLSTLALKTNGYIFMAVTGLTDKIASDVANAAGFPGAASLTPQMVAANPNAVAAAINAVRNDGYLHEVITSAGLDPGTFDPLGTPFRADGTGYDQVLDNIVVTTDANGATVIQPINCTAPKSWTVSGVTCTPDNGEETTIPSGTTIVHRDSVGPTVGTVGWSCMKGVVQPAVLPSCQVSTGPGPSSAPAR